MLMNETWVKDVVTNPQKNLIAWVNTFTHYVLVTGYYEG